jgi:hypothetical protein
MGGTGGGGHGESNPSEFSEEDHRGAVVISQS